MPQQLAEPDTSVVLPKAVRDAAAKAERLSAEQKAARNPQPEATASPANGNGGDNRPIGELVPAQPAPGATRFIDDAQAAATAAAATRSTAPVPAHQQPDPAPAPQPAPAAPAPAPAPLTAEEWEHRFRSQEGRFRQTADALAEANRRIIQLQGLLATGTSPAPANNPAGNGATPKELQPKSLLTAAERQEYGDEFVAVVQKAAREIFEPVIEDLQGRLATAQQQTAQVATDIVQDARSKMLALLDGTLPEWRRLNNEQRFIDWTELPDPFSGDIRRVLLQRAFDANKGQIVLNFFKGFLAEEAAQAPQGGAVAIPAAGALPGQAAGKVPLASFAAPGRATAAAGATATPEKPIIKRSEITQFYDLVNRGKFAGNEVEKKRLEAMIFEAQADGRIVNG